MKKFINIVICILILLLIYFIFPEKKITHDPGIIAPNDPIQQTLQKQKSFFHNENLITPLAKFSVEARVLSKNWHHFSRNSKIVPLDLALGWGRMSDEAVLSQIKVYQRGTKYYWSTKKMPIPRNEIVEHSANMHIIPADDQILKKLKKIRKGHVIRFDGYLIKLRSENGEKWNSSLTRKDFGNGACELVWMEQLEIQE